MLKAIQISSTNIKIAHTFKHLNCISDQIKEGVLTF